MKTTNKVLAIAVLVLGAQAAQAHIVDGVEHTHEARSQFQTMSATDRLNFRDENKANMELMSVEEREAFMADMNNGANLNRSNQNAMRTQMQSMSTEDRQAFRDNMQSMSTEDRQAFRDSMGGGQGGGMGQGTGEQHRYGGSSQGAGQGNQFMHGGSQGGGYGRGYGKR